VIASGATWEIDGGCFSSEEKHSSFGYAFCNFALDATEGDSLVAL
jgi:hypothetical protein